MVDTIPYSTKHDLVMGYQLQSYWICIEMKINWSTSHHQNSWKCGNFRERLRQSVDNNESHLTDLFLKHNETEWH